MVRVELKLLCKFNIIMNLTICTDIFYVFWDIIYFYGIYRNLLFNFKLGIYKLIKYSINTYYLLL